MAHFPGREEILRECFEMLDDCVKDLKEHFKDRLANGYMNWYPDLTVEFQEQELHNMLDKNKPYHNLITPLQVVAKAFMIWWVIKRTLAPLYGKNKDNQQKGVSE